MHPFLFIRQISVAIVLFFVIAPAFGQQQPPAIENMIIVTTDGLRWQEVFKGMDTALATDPRFNQSDSATIYANYWAETEQERRKKLMPFLWTTIVQNGQIYGNRALGANVNVANPYWFSYPGYNEIFCGFADSLMNSNAKRLNPNTNLLEYINKQPRYTGQVAAFGAWDVFDYILNEQRSGVPVVCGKDHCGGDHPDAEQRLMNAMKDDAYYPWEGEQLDVFTHYAAMDYLQKQHPKVLYISYGETDEWAHAALYKDYLNAANQVDEWLGELWTFIQNDPKYRNKTLLFITVDHGRGDVMKEQWTSHNSKIPGSDQIWFAVMGPKIVAKGEIAAPVQLYQKQFALTLAELMGLHFQCEHSVAPGFKEMLMK